MKQFLIFASLLLTLLFSVLWLRTRTLKRFPAAPKAVYQMEIENGAAPLTDEDSPFHHTTPEDFEYYTESIMRKLPSHAEFQKLEEAERQHSSKSTEAMLDSISVAVQSDPSLARIALHFYETCSKAPDIASELRSLCYVHYREWGERLQAKLEIGKHKEGS